MHLWRWGHIHSLKIATNIEPHLSDLANEIQPGQYQVQYEDNWASKANRGGDGKLNKEVDQSNWATKMRKDSISI